jgi:hypothetical protein
LPVSQSADSGLAVAEREIERVQDARFLGVESVVPTPGNCSDSSRKAWRRGF